jgi:hypothetical protein
VTVRGSMKEERIERRGVAVEWAFEICSRVCFEQRYEVSVRFKRELEECLRTVRAEM